MNEKTDNLENLAQTMSLREQQLHALRQVVLTIHAEMRAYRTTVPHPQTFEETDKAIAEFIKLTEGVFHL